MATEATRALAGDLMRYIAKNGQVQSLRTRRAPLDLTAPIKKVSDLRYLEDCYIEDDRDEYSLSTRLHIDSYAEVTVENIYGELCVKRLEGSMNDILADMLADAAPEVDYEV